MKVWRKNLRLWTRNLRKSEVRSNKSKRNSSNRFSNFSKIKTWTISNKMDLKNSVSKICSCSTGWRRWSTRALKWSATGAHSWFPQLSSTSTWLIRNSKNSLRQRWITHSLISAGCEQPPAAQRTHSSSTPSSSNNAPSTVGASPWDDLTSLLKHPPSLLILALRSTTTLSSWLTSSKPNSSF